MQHLHASSRRKGAIRIPSQWFALAPGKGVGFLVKVHKRAKQLGIRKHDYEKIKQVIKEIDNA
jgi:hypothetical protein